MCQSMNICDYMSNKNCFKDIGKFPLKLFKKLHMMTLKILKCYAHKFSEFCCPNQKSLSFSLAEI